MRVAVRQRVLDDIAIRPVVDRRVEQRDDLAEDEGGFGHGGAPTGLSGAPTAAPWAAGPIFAQHARPIRPLLLALAASLLCGPAGRCGERRWRRGSSARSRCRTSTRPDRRARGRPPHRLRRLFAQRALSLVPASNEKLAVDLRGARPLLGRGYRFHTEVAGIGTQVGAVWRGDLVLTGTETRRSSAADLDALAAESPRSGISRVTGAVVGDESWFDARRTGPGWRPASTSRSRRRSRRSSSTARCTAAARRANPALAAASLFRAALEARGIRVAATGPAADAARRLPARAGRLPAARRRSSASWAGRATTSPPSCSLKHLGATPARHGGTTAAGMPRRPRSARRAGVPLTGVRLVDGSGLSRLNRAHRRAVVALLEAGLADPDMRDAFLASLAVAGRRRHARAPARARARPRRR